MGKTLDERASEIAASQNFGDIRIPLDVAARLQKSRSEKKDTVDEVDLEKIAAQKDADKQESPEKKEKPETEDEIDTAATPGAEESRGGDCYEKSFRTVEGSTLQKAHLMKMRRQPDAMLVKVGAWFSDSLQKADVPTLLKAIRVALPEFQKSGKTWVAGLKEPGSIPAGSGDAKILRLNTEVAKLQAALSAEGADPFDLSVLFNKLQNVYEQLAEAVMDSMGLGQQTEDLIPCDPKEEPPTAMVSHVSKSQAEEPVKIPENNTGKNIIVSL
jgi:hypothetical protein